MIKAKLSHLKQKELKAYLHKIKNAFSLDNLEIVNSALSSKPGEMTLEHVGSGSASLNFYDKDDTSTEDIEIKAIIMIFNLCEKNEWFIKCDVEGHEADVFMEKKTLIKYDSSF